MLHQPLAKTQCARHGRFDPRRAERVAASKMLSREREESERLIVAMKEELENLRNKARLLEYL